LPAAGNKIAGGLSDELGKVSGRKKYAYLAGELNLSNNKTEKIE
jgi:hypothetical protein